MAPIGGGPPVGSWAGASGTGSNLNYVGNHVFLYSGTVDVINTETTLFDCTTGSNQYIMAKLQIFHGTNSNEDFTYKIKLNSEIILQYTGNQASTVPYLSDEPILLLIPPNSRVVATGANDSSSTPRTHTATLTGRVYA